MKNRLLTALLTGVIAAGVGIAVAIWQHQHAHWPGIGIACGAVGFLFGLVFKFKPM